MAKKYEQTFIIDRSKWINGNTFTEYTSALYLKKGRKEMMCCLGFVCNQLGIPKKHLKGKGLPSNLKLDWDIPYLLESKPYQTTIGHSVVKNIVWDDSKLAEQAVTINDSKHVSLKDKEKQLKTLFSKYGLNIKFVGKFPENSKI